MVLPALKAASLDGPDRLRGLLADWSAETTGLAVARGWKREPSGAVVLGAESTALLELATAQFEGRLGRAARRELRAWSAQALGWCEAQYRADLGPFDRFARGVLARVWARFQAEFTTTGLWNEFVDEVERDEVVAARRARVVLAARELVRRRELERVEVAYATHWRQRLMRQVKHGRGPRALRVPGLTPDEVCDAMVDALLRAVGDPQVFAAHEAPGIQASFAVAARTRDRCGRSG